MSDGLAITVDVDQLAQAQASAKLREIAARTNRDMRPLVMQAVRFGVQSARKVTPRARKRKMRALGRMRKRSRKALGAPWWAEYAITVGRDKESVIFANSRDRALQLRTPRYTGLAKAAWSWGLAKSGQSATVPNQDVSKVAQRNADASVTASKGGAVVDAQITNRLRYMSKAAPNAATIGTVRAVRRLGGMLDRLAEKQSRGTI